MIACRRMTPADRQFVVSGWSSSFRKSEYAGVISMTTWADVMHREINAIIERPDTVVLVAEEHAEVDHLGRPFLYGFIARRRGSPYVYYTYVKHAYRRRGIASSLFTAADIDPRAPFGYACRTAVCAAIPAARWEPLTARYEDKREHETEQPRRNPRPHDQTYHPRQRASLAR